MYMHRLFYFKLHHGMVCFYSPGLILLTLACSICFGAQPWTVCTKLAQAHTHAAWFISVDTSSSTRVSYTRLLNFCTRSTTLALTCLLDSEQQASFVDDDDNQVIHRHDDTPHMVQLDYNIHRVTATWSCAASTNLLSRESVSYL